MLKHFEGIRAIGDVHGNYSPFREMVDEGISNKYFIISLGDLIDYGPDVPSVLDLMCSVIRNGQGTFIRSNHDDRLWRHHRGSGKVKQPENFRDTLRQLSDSWLTFEFLNHYESARYWLRYGQHFFVHGGFVPKMLEVDSINHPFVDKKLKSYLRKFALYGESDGTTDPITGFPNRTYNWVNEIPRNLTVIVGHSIRDKNQPFFEGDAVFLDTGSGKGGKLSCMDITFAMPEYPKFKTI